MNTVAPTSSQIKVTLPFELQQYAQHKADRFGLSLASYIRHLVLNDVQKEEIPVFQMSQKTEKVAEKALAEYRDGKTTSISDIDEFLNDV